VDALADEATVEVGDPRHDRLDPALGDLALEGPAVEDPRERPQGRQAPSSSTVWKSESCGGASSVSTATGYSFEKQASQNPRFVDCPTFRSTASER
jgi:hypothetical protein